MKNQIPGDGICCMWRCCNLAVMAVKHLSGLLAKWRAVRGECLVYARLPLQATGAARSTASAC